MTELDLAQRRLALEHEAVWVYGLIGARVRSFEEPARVQVAAHRTARDRVAGRVTALGGRPVGAKASYDVAVPSDEAAARALAQQVQARIAAVCVRAVAVTTGRQRDRAVQDLREAALGQVRWGGAPEAFPGLD